MMFFTHCANKKLHLKQKCIIFRHCVLFHFIFGLAGRKCVVYDAVFHPDTYKKGREV